jgi:uncharacterized protein (UPF0303 family)
MKKAKERMMTVEPEVQERAQEMLTGLEEQNRAIAFSRFDHVDAFTLGSRLLDTGRAGDLPIAVTVTFGQQRVFHGALRGTNAANDDWLDRKLRVVAMYDAPSLLVQVRLHALGVDFDEVARVDLLRYVAAGGGFPIRVAGSLIGAVAVSGLTDIEDHNLAFAALSEYLKVQS